MRDIAACRLVLVVIGDFSDDTQNATYDVSDGHFPWLCSHEFPPYGSDPLYEFLGITNALGRDDTQQKLRGRECALPRVPYLPSLEQGDKQLHRRLNVVSLQMF